MNWLQSIVEFFKALPSVAQLFEKWIDLKEKELPMKFDKHEERKPVREVDAHWDKERRDDRGQNADNRRDSKREYGPFWRIKKKRDKK